VDVFGSFALVLAFICAVYAFGGGIAAILTRHPAADQEYAPGRNCHLRTDFPRHAQPRIISSSAIIFPSPTLRRIATAICRHFIRSPRCGRAGRFAAVLELPAGDLCFFGVGHLQEQERRVDAVVGVVMAGVQIFSLDAEQFRREPIQGAGSAGSKRRDGPGRAGPTAMD